VTSPLSRSHGIDVARGLAVVLMIQTHAYDGWVHPEARTSFAFQLTRWVGALPLPLFLALAGISLGLRVRKAYERQDSAQQLRRALLRTGARVLGWGYALNLAYAALDGAGPIALLRVDVLHAIGLAILGLAACVEAGSVPPSPRGFARRSALLACIALALCPLATRVGHELSAGIARFLLAPFIEVPGLSTMPSIPLAFFCAAFAAFAARWPLESLDTRQTWQTLAAFALCYAVGESASHASESSDIPIARTSPGIWANALSASGRTGLVITLAASFARSPAPGLSLLHSLGQHSLFVYGLHLPFCYGRFARPIKHALSFGGATACLVMLCAGCTAAVWARTKLENAGSPALPRRLF
jgi:uncharacterized membrane protein